MEIVVSGQIGSDPSGAPWTLVDPEDPTVELYVIRNPLPPGTTDHWSVAEGHCITLVVEDGPDEWVSSDRFTDMAAVDQGHVVIGCIDSDPTEPDWRLKVREDDGSTRDMTIGNRLPPLPPPPPGNPHRWKIGDYITLDCKSEDRGVGWWTPSRRYVGLGR